MPQSDLSASWHKLWRRLGAHGDSGAMYENLEARYSEPGRAYHNLTHIEHCLRELQDARKLAADPCAIEFALWFHDAIYDTRAKDNEERSAALAREAALAAKLPATFVSDVARLILATKHIETPTASDEQIVVDIDLAILGQEPPVFDRYETEIRDEYAWVPAEAFSLGRSAILTSFLARPHIYSTGFFQGKYEQSARVNLANSIAKLNRSSSGAA